MTTGTSYGFFTQGGGGNDVQNALIATVPAGARLTTIDVRGVLATESASGIYPASAFTTLNLMTGLQWVTHGGTPFSVVNIPVASGNWLQFGAGFDMYTGRFQADTGVSVTAFDYIRISERWRGLFSNASSVDVYWSFGENSALSDTVNYRAFVSYRVEWATFP